MTDRAAPVLVVRPAPDGAALVDVLTEAGYEPLWLPGLEIEPVETAERPPEEPDIAVFVSRNAVRHGLARLSLPASTRIAAVGAATAAELTAAGRPADIVPAEGYTSEALLAEPALAAPAHGRIWIVRGVGGRALLGETLAERGAEVRYVEVYRRRPATPDPETLARVRHALVDGRMGAVVATSAETWLALLELLDEPARHALDRCPLVTSSDRVVKLAESRGHAAATLVADGPDPVALTAAVGRLTRPDAGPIEPRHESRLTDMSDQPRSDSGADPKPAGAKDGEPAADTAADTAADGMPDDGPDAAGAGEPEPVRRAEADEAAPERPRSGGGPGLIVWLALLVALLSAGVSGALWWQYRQFYVSLHAADLDAEQSRTRLGETIADVRQAVAELEARNDERTEELGATVARLRNEVDEVPALLEDLETRLAAEAAGVSDDARRRWLRAEAEYFLTVANTELQLAENPERARRALELADQRLAQLANPRLTPVREAIADELAALRALPEVDVASLALDLGALADRIDELPLARSAPAEFEAADDGGPAQPAEAPGIDRALGTLREALGSLVSVRRSDEPIRPQWTEQEVFYVTLNVELQLQAARLALLREQPGVFAATLSTAERWMRDYFDRDDPAVRAALESIDELRGTKIDPTMPDIGESLRLLRRIDTRLTETSPP